MGKKSIIQDQKKYLRSHFNKTSDFFHTIYEGDDFLNLHLSDRKNIVLNLVDKYMNGNRLSILDIGCGTGILSQSLAEKGHVVTGLDVAETMIEKLKESIVNSQDKIQLGAVIGDAEEICFSEHTFNAILCIGVLQYQLGNDRIFEEAARVLKKGGFCIFSIPNLLSFNYLLDPFYYVKFITRLFRKLFNQKVLSFTKARRELNRNGCITDGLTGKIEEMKLFSKKYLLWELNKIIRQNGFHIREIVAFGYGPITFMNKNIFSKNFSAAINNKLNKLVEKKYMGLLRLLANRWVFVLQKD